MVLDQSGKMLILYNRATFVCDGSDKSRVRTGPGKSWNLILAFSRTGKSCGKKATGPGKFWKSVGLKCMEGSEEKRGKNGR